MSCTRYNDIWLFTLQPLAQTGAVGLEELKDANWIMRKQLICRVMTLGGASANDPLAALLG